MFLLSGAGKRYAQFDNLLAYDRQSLMLFSWRDELIRFLSFL